MKLFWMTPLRLLLALFWILPTCVNSQTQSGPSEARLLLGGNYPDPTVLRDGEDYYMTHSSFNYHPGLLIWHSRDLRNWQPVVHALNQFEPTVWAPELVKHDNLYMIYIPALQDGKFSNWVTWSETIHGPWSKPVPVGVGHIDPGHIADEQGNRFLHLSGGHAVRLSDDGLKAVGDVMKIHEGWPIPRDWAIECFCLESPKLIKRGDHYHLTTAQGGTFGPSTSHMVTAFRSSSPLGPWESSPWNPVIRTWSRNEAWWSKGHGTLVEYHEGHWFIILHGIRNGHRSLGRSTLIEPIQWTKDGWYRVAPEWPEGWDSFQANMPLSDTFDNRSLGIQWQFHRRWDPSRFRLEQGRLHLKSHGGHAGASYPLTLVPRDSAYEVSVDVEAHPGAAGGLMLFVNENEYIGLSIDHSGQIRRTQKGYRFYRNRDEPSVGKGGVSFKIVNMNQDVRFYFKSANENWNIMQPSMEISQNGIVRLALFSTMQGEVSFDNFLYTSLLPE